MAQFKKMHRNIIKKIIANKIVKKLKTSKDKNLFHALKFRQEFDRVNGVDRLIAELKRLSGIWVSGFDNNTYQKRRRKKFTPYLLDCWICRKNKADCFHHIITLFHGGYNMGWNRIAVCNECHKKIHEWL